MGRFVLSESDEWELENSDQDIREWPVRDAQNKEVGRVAALIASTENEHVERIVLDNGDEHPVGDIELHDGIVWVEGIYQEKRTKEGPVIRQYENPKVHRSEATSTLKGDS